MRAIDILLTLACIFEIIIKCFVSQYQNFLLWENLCVSVLKIIIFVWRNKVCTTVHVNKNLHFRERERKRERERERERELRFRNIEL